MNGMSDYNIEDKYIPGVCNIGKPEINRRKQAGWTGLIITVILLGLFIYFDMPHPWRLIIFIPAMITAIGFLQARMHFCAYFGMRGLFNFSPEIGKTDTVEQAEFRAIDRRKAWQIITYSAITGVVVAIIFYYLPV
jgi:fatty acid desaturase